jgi:anti-sigma B factor antagonist
VNRFTRDPETAADASAAFAVHRARPGGRDTPTLHIRGEVDLQRRDELREQLDALIAEGESPGMVDLSCVTFLDSSGVAELVEAQKRAAESSTRIILVAPSPPVVTILELTGLERFFEIRPDEDPAAPASRR